MKLLKNIKFFKILLVIFLSNSALASSQDDLNLPTYDKLAVEEGLIQTSSGKVKTQRVHGVLLWEDIPFAAVSYTHLTLPTIPGV